MPKLPRDADPRKVIRAFERLGFQMVSVEGGHYKLVHGDDTSRIVIVPFHAKLRTGTLAALLKQARVRLETFLEVFFIP